MNKKDLTFTITFIVTLSVLLYFLGASITGYITQSMYCEDGVCKEFCRFDTNCNKNEVCCQKHDFGVCEISSQCEKPYVFQTEEVDIEKTPYLEMPSPSKNKITLYSVLVIIAIIIAIIYFSKRKTTKPKRKK